MEEYGGGFLLSEAIVSGARVVVVEDCVEAPAAFVHHLLKRALAGGGSAALLALAQPLSHYDRVLRKMVGTRGGAIADRTALLDYTVTFREWWRQTGQEKMQASS